MDYLKGELLLKAYDAGNSDSTIDYLRYLKSAIPTDIAFNTDGSFIVIYGGSGAYRTQGIPQSLIDEIIRINQNSIRNPSTAYRYFTGVGLTSNNGWVLLYRSPL